jgi:predicted ATPase
MTYTPPQHLLSAHNRILAFLKQFDKDPSNTTCKRGLYIYGDSGSGKTSLIHNTLESLNYDIIKYDAGDVRNKLVIETIFKIARKKF